MSGFNTSLLHDGVDDYPNGATLVPIYQSSAFKHESAEELERIFDNKAMGFSYTRINNPTIEAFEKRITKLEKGFSSVACSSGMAAIFNSIANIVRQGDEVVASCGLYGGTVELFEDLESFGITVKYVADNKPECFEELITDKTRVVFAETIGNPKLDVTDIKAVADVAHAHGIPLIVDNTVSTPYLIQPITLGADVVVNSSSKYINGSSDAISGILTFNGKFKFDKEKYPGLKPYLKFGPMAYIIKLRNGLFRNTGGCLSPQNAFLNNLGLETLGLRMERHCSNAYELARYLDTFEGITVNYPGLKPYLKFGPMAYIIKLRNGLFRNTGGCLSPQNAFLNNLGLETLGLRMERHCSNAYELARYLDTFEGITVNYPGLESSPYHEVADKQFTKGYGAIITFRVGSKERAFKIINALKIPNIVSNIGDTKTLVIHPASTIALHLSDKDKEASGVYDDLIRVSVGIEDIDDLKEDFRAALESTDNE